MGVRGITAMRRRPAQQRRARSRTVTIMTVGTGWLGHKDIPRPARVLREYARQSVDWLDCLLALWIAEAMLGDPEEEAL